MPEYTVVLKDGRTVVLRASSRPSEEQVRAAVARGGVRHVSGGSEPAMRPTRPEAPGMMTPQNIGPFVAQGAKDLYGYVTKNPERSIEIAGPAAGAMIGGGVGGPPGALIGAGAGYLYGKANRAASNVSQGKPVTTGMPQTPGAAAMEPIDAILGNAGPEMVLPSVVRGLRAAGTHLVGSAMHPPLSTINDMAEMGRRGTLPMDVRKQGAVDAIELANRHGNASPVSDANVRSLVGELGADLNTVDEGAEALRAAGRPFDMGPITGEAGGYAVHQVRPPATVGGGSPTPSGSLPGVRNRIKAYQRDPESSLTRDVWGLEAKRTEPLADTVEYTSKRGDVLAENLEYTSKPGPVLARELEYKTKPTGTLAREFDVVGDPSRQIMPRQVVEPGDSILEGIKTQTGHGDELLRGVRFGAKSDGPYSQGVTFGAKSGGTSVEGVEFNPFSRRVPNDKADAVDLLKKRRYESGELRGSYGLNPDNADATIVDKAWYRATGDALKDASPDIASALEREHRGMNLLQMMVPQQYLQSGAKPVNLYTLLGTLSGNPAAIALGIGNYPYVMAAGGKGLYNAGTRIAEHSGDTANLTRAILATMLANQRDK